MEDEDEYFTARDTDYDEEEDEELSRVNVNEDIMK